MEYSISIRDMWIICKKRWKTILLCGLVIALLAAGYKGMKSIQDGGSNGEKASGSQAQYEEEMEAFEDWGELRDDMISSLQKQLRDANVTWDKDPVMALDPGNCTYRNVTASFDGEANHINTVIAWIQGIKAEDLFGDQAKTLNPYRMDLCTVMGSAQSGDVEIHVYKADDFDYERAAEAIKSTIEKSAKDDNLDLVGVKNVAVTGRDQALYDKQSSLQDNVIRLQNQKKTLEDYSNVVSAPDAPATTGGVSKKGILKYALAGLVLGLILGIAWVIWRMGRRGAILSADQFEEMFAIDRLGDGSDLPRILANLDASMGKDASLLLIGEKEPCQRLADAIIEEGSYYVSVGNNIVDDVEALEHLGKAQGILVGITPGVTDVATIHKSLLKAERLGKSVVGYVVL